MAETDEKAERLYELLPVIYRMRDAEEGYPLKALLRVIGEQVGVIEDDIQRLYENWFIETAEDWAVPYIGDLLGYHAAYEAGQPRRPDTAEGAAANKILISRRAVANTIRYRRRKGSLALLELLAGDVAGWPARAVEFYKLLGWAQNLNHLRPDRGRSVDVREMEALDLLGGPFERLAHTADVRRVNSNRARGRPNIPEVGVFVWRLKSYSVTRTQAFCLESSGPHRYTFSVLGNNTPLFVKPEPEPEPTQIAGELNVPARIRRRAFENRKEDFYGEGKSLAVWARDWSEYDSQTPVPAHAVIVADLTGWHYSPPLDHIAIDPVLGRLAFNPDQLPRRVRVLYHYGFSADMGGGEYKRQLSQQSGAVVYRVGANERFRHVHDALERWRQDKPTDAVIELADSSVYVENVHASIAPDRSLQIRAAEGVRPIIKLLDWRVDAPDPMDFKLARGSSLTLDGLMIVGRAVHIRGRRSRRGVKEERPRAKYEGQGTPDDAEEGTPCDSEVNIRHCTLVPGWEIHNDCEPSRPAEPSLELYNVRARVNISHSILGSIQINEDEVRAEPIPLEINDSIIDATDARREALGAPGEPVAHAVLTIRRTTVYGYVQVHAIRLAENSIFTNCLNVARRQLGCMRFCYVPAGCRTPRRFNCQPDLAEQAALAQFEEVHHRKPTPAEADAARRRERERVRPQFNSIRYGSPDYAQLAETCAEEIKRGADDESEMGVFHDLFQPQRAANLRARLSDYTPAGMDVGVLFVS